MYFYLLLNWQDSGQNSPTLWERYIERLSEYMESSGKLVKITGRKEPKRPKRRPRRL